MGHLWAAGGGARARRKGAEVGAAAEVTVCHGNCRARGGGASRRLFPLGARGGFGASLRLASSPRRFPPRRALRGCCGAAGDTARRRALVRAAVPSPLCPELLSGVAKHRNNRSGVADGTKGSGWLPSGTCAESPARRPSTAEPGVPRRAGRGCGGLQLPRCSAFMNGQVPQGGPFNLGRALGCSCWLTEAI